MKSWCYVSVRCTSFYCSATFVAGFSDHGRNFEAVAKAITTKTVAQCKNFFFNYKRKYNLPKLVSDYEIRNVRYVFSTCVCSLCLDKHCTCTTSNLLVY